MRIMVLPSREVEEILTWPKQMMKTFRAASPSVNSFAPRAWLIMMPMLSKSCKSFRCEIAEHPQMAVLAIETIFRGVMRMDSSHTFSEELFRV